MASLEIAYYVKDRNENMCGNGIRAETISTLSATHQESGATPSEADYVVITPNGGAARFSYTGTASVASATTPWLADGQERWLPARAGWKVSAISG